LLDDVERVADRVMVLARGRLTVDTTMDDFASRVSGFITEVGPVEPELMATIPGLIEARRIGDRLQLVVTDADQHTRAVVERLGGSSIESIELSFADSVLSYLARDRGESSFLGVDRMGVGR
jgi:ABC-type multidrug transport system ATPase subunit